MVSKRKAVLNKKIMKVILKGRSNGLKWREICKQVKDKFNIYVSTSALQQRYQYFMKMNNSFTTATVLLSPKLKKAAKAAVKSWSKKVKDVTVTVETYDGKVNEFQSYLDSYIAKKIADAKAQMKGNLQVAIDNLMSMIDSSVKHFTDNIKQDLGEALNKLE